MAKPTAPIIEARTKIEIREREIATLEALQTKTEQELARLECEADITSAKDLAEVSRLRTLGSLLPRRLEHRESMLVQEKNDLVTVCRELKNAFLVPRCLNQLARAREIMRGRLTDMFTNKADMDSAIGSSALVVEVTNVKETASFIGQYNTPGEVFAENLLNCFEKSLALDANLK
jgi:hypothetical protein